MAFGKGGGNFGGGGGGGATYGGPATPEATVQPVAPKKQSKPFTKKSSFGKPKGFTPAARGSMSGGGR